MSFMLRVGYLIQILMKRIKGLQCISIYRGLAYLNGECVVGYCKVRFGKFCHWLHIGNVGFTVFHLVQENITIHTLGKAQQHLRLTIKGVTLIPSSCPKKFLVSLLFYTKLAPYIANRNPFSIFLVYPLKRNT